MPECRNAHTFGIASFTFITTIEIQRPASVGKLFLTVYIYHSKVSLLQDSWNILYCCLLVNRPYGIVTEVGQCVFVDVERIF